jgi:DNA invertase Pin-like site-specific DNA recombinase
MLIGYARVSKADGIQVLDFQKDALLSLGIDKHNIYSDQASGKLDARAGLQSCIKGLRKDDTLVVWNLDRLGRDLRHLIDIVHDLQERGIVFKVITGQGANIDTTTANGKLIFSIFAAKSEYERKLIGERTKAGLASVPIYLPKVDI